MAVVRSIHKQSLISTNLIRVRFNESLLLPEYFVSLMTFCKGRVGRLKTGPDGAFTHMNTGVLDNLSFPYPSIIRQNEFLDKLKKIEQIKLNEKASLLEIERLQRSLSQKFFGQ